MQLAFSWWQLFDVLLSILWLISGIRDLWAKTSDPSPLQPVRTETRNIVLLAEEKRPCCFTFNAVVLSPGHLPAPGSLGRQLAFGCRCGRHSLSGCLRAWEHSDD